ncbi:MAG: hypothetical protein AAGL49_03490 [Pseudomonadota bacterium]
MMDIPSSKVLFGAVAFVLTFAAFYPYMRSILRGETRAHVFSWVIWSAVTFIVFIAQMSDGAGIGAWPIGLSGIITISVAVLAYVKRGDTTIVPLDWVFLGLALCAPPLWVVTDTALSAVVLLTFLDLVGFGPTVRKAYQAPYEENALFFSIGALRNFFVLLALENYSWTTVLFPAAVGAACVLFVGLILARRRVLADAQSLTGRP